MWPSGTSRGELGWVTQACPRSPVAWFRVPPSGSASRSVYCATPSARVDSMSSLHCKRVSQRLLAQRAEGFDLPVLIYPFENVPHLRSLTTETLGESSLIFHHCRPVRVRQSDREREFVSQVLVHPRTLFVFKKKINLNRTAVRLYDFFELCRPSQFAPTATVLNFTRSFVHLGPPVTAAADSPAAPG